MDSNTPRVTVVVPCFAKAHFLKESLGSVRAQTLDSWRAVVVDDGSADPSEVEQELANLDDKRIELVTHEHNRGRAAARNSGIGATETEFVLMLDADDRLAPDCLERLVAALDGDAARDCAYPDVRTFGRQESVRVYPTPKDGKPLFAEGDVPPVSGALMRRTFLERVGSFDEATELAPKREDFEFWLRAFQTQCVAEHVAAPLYERRVTHMSFYGDPNVDQVADYVVGKHRAAFAGFENAFRAHWYAQAAQASYARGDRKGSFALSVRARRTHSKSVGLKGALRSLLPFSANRALDAGALRRPVPFLGYPLNGKARHRPFFVIGLGHSGNALFRRILTSHSQLHMPPEAWVLDSCIRKYKKQQSRLSWPDLVAVVMAEFAFHPEFHRFEVDLAPVVQRLSFVPKHQRNLATLINAVFHHHAETHGQSCVRWGDDAPLNSLDDAVARGDQPKNVGEGVPQTLERLLEVFPDAQFLHLYRDGCEVVSSYLRDGVFDNVESGATRWLHVELQTSRFVAKHPGSSFDVRYEDLIAKPEEIVRGVCTFLELDFEPAMLGTESDPIAMGDAGEARKRFSAEEKATLQGMLGSALSDRGYPPATD